MKITYIYHSGFAIEGDDFTIIIDYYKDSSDKPEQGVVHHLLTSRPGKFYILSSHSHADHFNEEILSWKQIRPDIRYIFSKDILETQKAGTKDALFLEKTGSYKDEILSIKAFGSTDIGISFLIEAGGKRIFHAGDLNNWHWKEESTKEESQEYEDHFLQELELLATQTTSLDVAMFPVDPRLGKDYMLGARQLIDRIKTSVFIPMHFWEKYEKANTFASYAESKECRFITLHHRGDSVEL